MRKEPLSAELLFRACEKSALHFDTTRDLIAGEGKTPVALGQERATDAINFSARMSHDGYNLFVLGPPGLGKHNSVFKLLKAKAAEMAAPADWVYVHNFATPHKPKALSVGSGRGPDLRQAMERLIDDVRSAVPAAFESEDYQKRREAIEDEMRERQESLFSELGEEAEAKGIALMRTPMGFALAPVRKGKVLRPEEFQKLSEADRKKIQEDSADLQEKLESLVKQIPRLRKETTDRIRELNEEVTSLVVNHPIEEVASKFTDEPDVIAHLGEVRSDLIKNVHKILGAERSLEQGAASAATNLAHVDGENPFKRYEVNLIVASDGEGAPLVYEDHPTLSRLLGRIEHVSRFGALVTDVSMIKAGALHRANGGYLVLDARELLTQPFAWDALKRALSSNKISVESPIEFLSLISTTSLEPEPIPLSVKVVLIGERFLYFLLSALDPAFLRLFKIAADFNESVDRNAGSEFAMARLLAATADREGLRPFESPAIGRIIEEMSRHAADSEKISVMLGRADDLLRESDLFAEDSGEDVVRISHVEQAVLAREQRGNRLRKEADEAIRRGFLLIRSEGEAVGQVNGLTVMPLAGFTFGRPTRISAQVRLGSGKILDIEREVELGGPIHSKGVLILSGFLAGHFALEAPLSLAANLVFEQSYGGVEGDSASCAELYALLSAIGEVPVKQSIAVTGSLNQHGEVQAIGGVNEKIEGFFEVCANRGLTGEQGVLLPAANVANLMLRDHVVEACRQGQFAIYAIDHVDQGLELLTGRPAGERESSGRYSEGSVYAAVEKRLQTFARARRGFARSSNARDNGEFLEPSS